MILRHDDRWCIFISGRGSNMQALLDLGEEMKVVLVVSSSANAAGLLRAKRMGIPTIVLDKKINWMNLSIELKKRRITKIFLAGFMRLISEEFVNEWSQKILNVHPSLLPGFPGLHAIEKSFDSGEAMGVTVHVVVPKMDAGPIVMQKKAIESLKNRSFLISIEIAKYMISWVEQNLVRRAVLSWK